MHYIRCEQTMSLFDVTTQFAKGKNIFKGLCENMSHNVCSTSLVQKCSTLLVQEGIKSNEDARSINQFKEEIKRLKAQLERTKKYYLSERDEIKANYFVECEKNELLQTQYEKLERRYLRADAQRCDLKNDIRISEMQRREWKKKCKQLERDESKRKKEFSKTHSTMHYRSNGQVFKQILDRELVVEKQEHTVSDDAERKSKILVGRKEMSPLKLNDGMGSHHAATVVTQKFPTVVAKKQPTVFPKEHPPVAAKKQPTVIVKKVNNREPSSQQICRQAKQTAQERRLDMTFNIVRKPSYFASCNQNIFPRTTATKTSFTAPKKSIIKTFTEPFPKLYCAQ